MLFTSSVLIITFCVCSSTFADAYGDTSFQVPNLPQSYGEDDSIQPNIEMFSRDGPTGKIVPLYSSVSYGSLGPADISVQQNVSQLNICSSNTAYCYNEVDNDFNVNPP